MIDGGRERFRRGLDGGTCGTVRADSSAFVIGCEMKKPAQAVARAGFYSTFATGARRRPRLARHWPIGRMRQRSSAFSSTCWMPASSQPSFPSSASTGSRSRRTAPPPRLPTRGSGRGSARSPDTRTRDPRRPAISALSCTTSVRFGWLPRASMSSFTSANISGVVNSRMSFTLPRPTRPAGARSTPSRYAGTLRYRNPPARPAAARRPACSRRFAARYHPRTAPL